VEDALAAKGLSDFLDSRAGVPCRTLPEVNRYVLYLRRDFQVDQDGPLLVKYSTYVGGQVLQVIEVVCSGVARAGGHVLKAQLPFTGNGLSPRYGVAPVLKDKVVQVGWRPLADGGKGSQDHP